MRRADLPGVYDLPDERGHFGQYGGVFVAETLIRALDELKTQYARYRDDADFRAEFAYELKHYVGRPSPVYHARRWSEKLGDAEVLTGVGANDILAWAAKDQTRVTDPYFMQVSADGKVAGRETIRETIRATGPTTHRNFGKQAGNN